MIDIEKAIKEIKESAELSAMQRTPMSLSEDDAMQLVQAIGLQMLHGFTIDTANEKAYKSIIGWICGVKMNAIDPYNGRTIVGDVKKGLYIAGSSGSGKSVCMAILSKMLYFTGASYVFHKNRVPMTLRTYRAEEICRDFAKNGSLEDYIKIPVLCINDIGAESTDALYMGNRCEVIRQIIEGRGDRNGQFTFVTSNLKFGRIRERYGDRVFSRLFSMFNYIELAGEDRRIKHY